MVEINSSQLLLTLSLIVVALVVAYLFAKKKKQQSTFEILNKYADRTKHILYFEKRGQLLMNIEQATIEVRAVVEEMGQSNNNNDEQPSPTILLKKSSSCTLQLFDEQLIIIDRQQHNKKKSSSASSDDEKDIITRIIPLYEFYAVHTLSSSSEEEISVELLSLNIITNQRERMIISLPVNNNSCEKKEIDQFIELLTRKIFRIESSESVKQLSDSNKRNLLIFINPKSGSGQSLHYFNKIVKPMIKESHIGNNFEVIVSKRAGHIREYCENELHLTQFNEIVTCGGDGTMNEVINGLIPRLEREGKLNLLSKMRFGVIPTGSGNAVSCHFQKAMVGFNVITNDVSLVRRATLIICRGCCSPMDLWTVFQPGKGKTYGFVSFSFGGIADVDVDTEFIRFIGDFRFILGSIWYACFGRYYTGNLTIIQPKKYESLRKQNGIDIKEFKGNHLISSAFSAGQDDSSLRSVELDSPISRQFLSKELTEMGLSKYLQDPNSKKNTDDEVSVEEYVKHEEVDQSFTYMFASNVSHAAADFVASHLSFHNDCLVDLMYVKKPASPLDLLSILLSCEKGDYHKHDKWLYRKIKAMYFKPTSTKKSYLTIDGEAVEYAPIILENIGSHLNFIGGDVH